MYKISTSTTMIKENIKFSDMDGRMAGGQKIKNKITLALSSTRLSPSKKIKHYSFEFFYRFCNNHPKNLLN